jgi:hypothetical protein
VPEFPWNLGSRLNDRFIPQGDRLFAVDLSGKDSDSAEMRLLLDVAKKVREVVESVESEANRGEIIRQLLGPKRIIAEAARNSLISQMVQVYALAEPHK